MKLKLGALVLLVSRVLSSGWFLIACVASAFLIDSLTPVQAGHTNCDMKEGAPCHMKTCAAIDKRGKPSGARCSRYCAKGCCFCTKACSRDYPGPNPDEE